MNHKEFGEYAARLCAKLGKAKPDFWAALSIRQNVIDDAVKTRRLMCHNTVYDAHMNAHPENGKPCAGLAQYLRSRDRTAWELGRNKRAQAKWREGKK